jgi:DNA-binding NtrC family response regulator
MRVYLDGDVPREVAALLSGAGFEILSRGDCAAADAVVTFGDSSSALRARRHLRLRVAARRYSASDAESDDAQVAENPVHAATLIASWCVGRRAPMLTGNEATFHAIATALTAAPGEPILLEAETGTGKEMVARLIHAASEQAGGFVAVDCSMVEGEEPRESLTPAEETLAAVGGREAWSGKTVYLDNVDELSRAMQARALGAIRARAQAGEAGARYVASSHRHLGEMVRRGLFNRDLHDALASRIVILPALRHRGADISLLARHFLALSDARLSFTPGALRALSEYPFPGNVRELKNLVRRLAIVPLGASASVVDAPDVREQIIVAARQKAERPRAGWRAAVEAANREIALRTVTAFGGDIHAAAQRLGLSVSTLRRSLRSAKVVAMPGRRGL